MKRFLLFSFLLLIGVCSSVTWGAEHSQTINGVWWKVNDDGEIINCFYFGSSVTVPNKVDTITIVGFSAGFDAFKNCTTLTTIDFSQALSLKSLNDNFCKGATNLSSVIFGNSPIESIGKSAFESCTSLMSITLPSTVKTIGSYAFKNCVFTQINIPDSLSQFDKSAYENCNNILQVNWDANCNVPDYAFNGRSALSAVVFGNTEDISIGKFAFQNCSTLTILTLTDNITSFGTSSFKNCPIKSIKIPAKLTSVIFSSSFEGCNNIETIYWNADIAVPSNVFNKQSLKMVVFGSSCTKGISANAFSGCTNLETVDFSNARISSIGVSAFAGCTSLRSAILPNGVKYIYDLAFDNCTSLDSLRIPRSVISISTGATTSSFPSATLSSIEYLEYNSDTLIPPFTFGNASSLRSVVFRNEVDNKIKAYTFKDCQTLESVDFGEHISVIKDAAFFNCTALDSVVFKRTTPPKITGGAFAGGPSDRKYYIPCGSYTSYDTTANTPCNGANTIEKCDEQDYTIGDVTLDHNIVCNNATITRNDYKSNAAITMTAGDYSIDANSLTINWNFDAHHFYYFTLPFDCNVNDIAIDNETVQTHYITNWKAALSDSEYDNGGWQILKYDEPTYVGGASGQSAYVVVPQSGTLEAGVSYMFGLLNPINTKGDFNVTATFAYNGEYSFNKDIEIVAPSSYTDSESKKKKGTNLYGNPFYWYIPISNFGVQSANVISPATTVGGKSTITNKSGVESLLPGEALFVQVADNSGITIYATPAAASAPARYSNQRPIRLILSHGNKQDDHMFIKSDAEASVNYVIGEDCYKMKNDGLNQIYTIVEDSIETAFNCLNLEGSVRSIPVGFTIVNSGTFQIAVADGTNFMPGTILKLRDTQSGAEYNLLDAPATLTLGKGITDGRYVIDIMDIPCDNENILEDASFSAYVSDGVLVVEGIETDAKVIVYDASGRMVTSLTASSDVVNLDLTVRGVYFVNVNGQTIKTVY